VRINGSIDLSFRAVLLGSPDPTDGAVAAAGLAGPISGGEVDTNGNIVLYDDQGNSRTLGSEQVSAASVHSTTFFVDPELTWVLSATLDSDIVPANLSLHIDPSILTEEFQREYAVIVLVADTRAGPPSENVTLVPIQLANIGALLWGSLIAKE
jgi:hypothetical protein